MVAYAIVTLLVIIGVGWALYKLLSWAFVKPAPKPSPSVEGKRAELDALRRQSKDLKVEVEVTEDLANTDAQIEDFKHQLEEAENKRSK